MIGLRRALIVIGLAGLGLGALAIVVVASSHDESSKTTTLILGPFVGWSFIGVGLYAWWRRPDNRVGALMTAVGFAFAVSSLLESNQPLLYTAGVWLSIVYLGEHYIVDIIGGVIFAIAAFLAEDVLSQWWAGQAADRLSAKSARPSS